MLINSMTCRKIIDIFNISIIILILLFSFISLDSQRKWTIFYSGMIEIRNKNNNIVDYISKTEQYFLNEIDHKDDIKNTNPDDLIYLLKTREKKVTNVISFLYKEIIRGIDDGRYQKGY